MLESLLRSRKFWLAVFGLVQTVVLHYFAIPEEIWQAVDVLVVTLIATIALEDMGAKMGGNPPSQGQG